MVEWKKMWEVTTWDKKFSGVEKYMQPKVIKYYYYLANELADLERLSGDIRILYTTNKEAYTNSIDVEGTISEGEVVTIPWGGNVNIQYYNGKFVTADNRIATSNNTDYLNNKFLYYWMLSQKDEIAKMYRGAGIQHPSMLSVLSMSIPIPSLEEQTRIVGILDTFTSAIDNLKEQIAQRRKQYEYYRDQLLDLEGKPGVEMKMLGEVGEFIRGAGILKSDFVDEGFPCIHYGQIHTRYGISATKAISHIDESLYKKSKKAVKGDVILATTSEDAEGCAKPVAWLGEEEVAVSGDAYIYHHSQNGKFMAYQFMTHNFMLFKIMNATGAKVVRISGDNMAKYEFPLPPLQEQERIVSILDTFEASIQNLEAQLDQRQKQYEYYRNKLLTFE